MLDHADTYSQAFDKSIYLKLQRGEKVQDAWKYSSFWYKNFDEMAKKTVIRQLLSKWGIMSVEMQDAYIKDQTEMKADGSYDYIDSKFNSQTTEDVREQQEEQTASVKVDPITAEIIEESPEEKSNKVIDKFINKKEEQKQEINNDWMN